MNRWIFQILTQSRRERGSKISQIEAQREKFTSTPDTFIDQKNSAALLLCASALNFPSARRNQWTRL